MPLIHTIVHPTDFSHNAEGAFQMACALAKDYKARLLLFHVSAAGHRSLGPRTR